MRTNIVIDEDLLAEVFRLTGVKTKRQAVELGLKALINLGEQARIKDLRGSLIWDGGKETASHP